MSMDRREFLKLIGLSSIGIGAGWILRKPGEFLEASLVSDLPDAIKAKQWGMVINAGKFRTEADYKKVIDACHKEHNVPAIGDPNHEIKWIWTDNFEHTFPEAKHQYMAEDLKDRMVLLLCNQCKNPPCVRVCPTKATFKRKDGITQQDMHRCIGCRFCMSACPYGARSFNYRNPRPYIKETNPEYPTRMIGVVEKCIFCERRLARGLMPACVEASNGAMLFGDLSDPNSEVREALRKHYTLVRKPKLGTQPVVFYIFDLGTEQGGDEYA